jgi:hypothetical protein
VITAGSVITATIRISPWHRGQVSGSTSKMRRSSSAQRNRAARSDQSTGSTIATGASAASLACRRRAPRVRLAYPDTTYQDAPSLSFNEHPLTIYAFQPVCEYLRNHHGA